MKSKTDIATIESEHNDSRSKKITLPKISEQKIQTGGGDLVDNPFYVPPDFEIFKMKEKEKENRKEERLKTSSLKIWQKGLKNNMAGRLKALCNVEIEEEEDENTKAEGNKLNIIEAAKSAIKNQVRQKEPMHKFIEKKREMFLFQMLIDHKREQINDFEEMTRLHEKGLQKSELMLEEDLEAFNKFLEENRIKSRAAIKKAEDKSKKKAAKHQEIKQLYDQRGDLFTKNGQKLERIKTLWEYKTFLDAIIPNRNQFLQKIEEKKAERKALKKKEAKRRSSLQSSEPKSENSDKIEKPKGKDFEMYKMDVDPQLLAMLEDSDNECELYFQNPQELESIFETYEGRNLSLITYTKEREQDYEEIKTKFDRNKKILDEKHLKLVKIKEGLEDRLRLINDEIKLKRSQLTKNESHSQEWLKALADAIQNEFDKYMGHEASSKEKATKNTLEILKTLCIENLREMEKILETQLVELKYYKNLEKDPKFKAFKEEENARIKNKKDMQKKAIEDFQQKKIMEQQEMLRNKPVATKRIGRPIMKRNYLEEEKKVEEVVEETPEEEKERKLFFE